ncbi:MAG: hypothetical protein ACRD8W_28710, partial [Nitrososphaeraceae archaeon]
MTKGKTVVSAIILLVLLSVVPHFTHAASGRVCNCVQSTAIWQPASSQNSRVYRESNDSTQPDKTIGKLMIRGPPKNKVVISDRLASYIQQINITFGHAKDLIREAYRIATEEENYTPEDAKNLLLENITVFSKRTIYSSLPDECKDQAQQQRRLNKRKPVAILQPSGRKEMEKANFMQNPTDIDNSTDMQKSYDKHNILQTESKEIYGELGQRQKSNVQPRGQITEFKLSGNMIDEFLSYIGMISKEDYCLGWIHNGELIDWEISPILE